MVLLEKILVKFIILEYSAFLRNGNNFLYDETDETHDDNLYLTGKSNPKKLYKSGFARKGLYNNTIIGCLSNIHDNKDIYNVVIFDDKFKEYLKLNKTNIESKYQTEHIDKYIIKSLESLKNKTIINFKINDCKSEIFNELDMKVYCINIKILYILSPGHMGFIVFRYLWLAVLTRTTLRIINKIQPKDISWCFENGWW